MAPRRIPLPCGDIVSEGLLWTPTRIPSPPEPLCPPDWYVVCLSAIAERPQWRYDARLLLLPRSPLTTTTEPGATPRLMTTATALALYDYAGTLRPIRTNRSGGYFARECICVHHW